MSVAAQSLGQQVRSYREARGWTRKELAHAISCAVVTLQKIERDERRPSLALVQLLAQALDLNAEQAAALLMHLHQTPRECTSPAAESAPVVPALTTALVGRTAEMAEIVRLLLSGQTRLLTLTGPGGVGKTSLATTVVATLASHFRDGVFTVELAALQHPELVLDTIARTVGLPTDGDRPLLPRLLAFLQPKALLVYLYNVEHLLPATPLFAELLAGCPNLSLLATSREPLRLAADLVLPIAPLALPLPKAITQEPLCAALASPAVALFVQRAQAVKPTFTLTADNAVALSQLCIHLDGLPLAIELVAARSRLLTPDALLARFVTATGQPRIGLLARERATLSGSQPGRQRTLHATLDWSYQLLTSAEQRAFCRFALFVGGCTLAAAEALLHDEQENADHAALYAWDLLSSLLDKSLLYERESNGAARFFMLATIREYARERLLDQAEAAAVQQRYARYYQGVAQGCFDNIVEGINVERWLAVTVQEHDNFRQTLGWAIARQEAEIALHTATALWRYWWIRGHWGEGRSWLEQALVMEGSAVGAIQGLRARALRSLGGICLAQGDRRAAHSYLAESVTLARAVADDYVEALALSSLATLCCGEGDFVLAEQYMLQSMAYDQKTNNERDLAVSYGILGEIGLYQADYPKAERYLRQALARQQARGDDHSLMITQLNLGHALYGQVQLEAAQSYLEAGLRLARMLGNPLGEASGLQQLAELHFALEQPVVAFSLLLDAFRLAEARSLQAIVVVLLRLLGEQLIKQGEPVAGVHFLGVCIAVEKQWGIVPAANEQARITRLLTYVRTHSDPLAVAAAYQEGQDAPLAVSLAAAHHRCRQQSHQ